MIAVQLLIRGGMAIRLKRARLPAPFSSLSLQKFLKSQRALPSSPPKLWRDVECDSSELDANGCQTLGLNHPVLRKVDSCTCIDQFNQALSQLLVLGLFQHPLAASRAVKKLCNLPGALSRAVSLFQRLEDPDAFICNSIVRGYLNMGDTQGALMFYYQYMIGNSVVPNHFTFPLLAKVCAQIGSILEGEKAHCRVLKCGFALDLFVRNSLIHMYSVCGRVREARRVFDEDSCSDLVTWNSMIDGYVKNGEVVEARKLFDEMCERDVFTWNSMIAGYVGIRDLAEARVLFDTMPCRDLVSFNCMIDGFSKIESVSSARELFNHMPVRNVVSWNIMLSLYVRCKNYNECMELFDQMISSEEIRPNEATFVSVLTACGHLGWLDKGKWIHMYINSDMSIKPDVLLSTALLTMYAKCGDMHNAKDVFDQMPEKSVVSWNSMIMGYGTHGCGKKALGMFVEMGKNGQQPNDATFTCLLAACAHTGMLLEGWWHFDMMRRIYKIEPKVEHYGCMVDLLGRAGLVKDSEELIKQMPLKAGSALWGALLSACHTHTNIKLGELVGRRLIEQEHKDIGAYLLLSNLYAAEGRWDDVENVRELMKVNGVLKVAGSSKTQSGDTECKLVIEDGSLHKRNMIYSMLREMGAYLKLPQQLQHT